MRTACCFLYVLFTAIYCLLAKDSMLWYGFGQITILGFVCVLGVFVLDGKKNTGIDKLFLQYICWLTGFRILYTAYCVTMNDQWVIHKTDVFAMINSVSFVVLLCYIAFNHSKIND